MYNRYIPNGASYTRVRVEEPARAPEPARLNRRDSGKRAAPAGRTPIAPAAAPVRAEPQASLSPPSSREKGVPGGWAAC